ncbi:sensor histidine kinase [Homoserinibacter sp. YIM 151385]|uniref:sensor histidine kinase n=1 Tax=Homoserinibacter sp. YIM 151385 TaxID=2985506 RepID=UPI0022F0E8F8|nr:ATP-binding protein [Homoserinibacter sp. YIM 151385]WBU39301.1 ATP-binding protein [Homoserinibacter sp. YIM 151385]
MDSGWLVAAALAFGLLLGAGLVIAVVVAHHRGQRAVAVITPQVPDGVDAVIDALESVGIVLDASNNVITSSPAAVSFGLVWNQALVHPELIDIVDRVRREGVPESDELHITRGPVGAMDLHLLVRVARLGARYILLLADDRTESYRLDDVRRDFVANVSHELKTPIGAVGLLAEAVESAADEPEEVRRFARRLTSESARLARITNEIIELSRLQAKDPLGDAALVDIGIVVARAVDENHVGAESKGIELVRKGGKHVEVLGNEPLLVTAVGNLISNAIRYSPEGSRVGVGVAHRDGLVEIAVTDQGIGIAEADRDRVFERFYRVDAARSRVTGGSGLGLSIVKHVVQNHGGDVRVWSQPGKGSTFTIRLPEATAHPAGTLGVTA